MDPRDFIDSRSLKHYLEEIAKFPTLTEAEEKALGEKVRKGDKEAIQALSRPTSASSSPTSRNTGGWASASSISSTRATSV
jgi:hypothetical protein